MAPGIKSYFDSSRFNFDCTEKKSIFDIIILNVLVKAVFT